MVRKYFVADHLTLSMTLSEPSSLWASILKHLLFWESDEASNERLYETNSDRKGPNSKAQIQQRPYKICAEPQRAWSKCNKWGIMGRARPEQVPAAVVDLVGKSYDSG